MDDVKTFHLAFDSLSENESFARSVVSAFIVSANPTLEEVAEIKTAVSEAVSNSIIHGYRGKNGTIYIDCKLRKDGLFQVDIKDEGQGIEDINLARQPLFSTNTDGERSGLGFTVMENFMDSVIVTSQLGKCTLVSMKKKLDVSYDE